ncbi:MAG: hypothetical protein LBR78_01175 [Holosporales bacterium]|jgi:hypothetical protein|nr:hypothetical protein [Holosporales bacterium]
MQRVVARQAHQLRCYQELIESYERLSRKLLRELSNVGRYRESIWRIHQMLDRCGGTHMYRDRLTEIIYNTAWTINGEVFEGRKFGWKWYEAGAGEMEWHAQMHITTAHAASDISQLSFDWIVAYLHNSDTNVPVYTTPARNEDKTYMCSGHIPTLPLSRRAEVAVVAIGCNGVTSYNVHPGDGSPIRGIHTYTDGSDGAWLDLPMSVSIRTVKQMGDTVGISPGTSWRAIIGEYTAP